MLTNILYNFVPYDEVIICKMTLMLFHLKTCNTFTLIYSSQICFYSLPFSDTLPLPLLEVSMYFSLVSIKLTVGCVTVYLKVCMHLCYEWSYANFSSPFLRDAVGEANHIDFIGQGG